MLTLLGAGVGASGPVAAEASATPTTFSQSATSANNWTNLSSMGAEDGACASCDMTAGFLTSQTALATGFGFAIPGGATITGLKVRIKRRQTDASTTRDNVVSLTKNGSAGVGTNKAASATNWPMSLTSVEYGGATDLWGTTWTPAEVNASTFGLALRVRDASSGATAEVDVIEVTVYYTV
ncbi:MAG TPA: hypothetical protein VJS44_08460 [Pyrinomonadaceae bacterium]|nr:hypothetical protein [Pyrinomonadaceae bacterium]